MVKFTINDSELQGVKDSVVIVTGGSSGIGLATVKRLLQNGAKVVVGDLNEPPEPEKAQVTFVPVDVTSWKQQLDLFKKTKEQYGRVDHVFANAGISPSINFIEEDLDENGDLAEPHSKTLDVNLTGCLYTVKLAVYYLKQTGGGSIVTTASASSFLRFQPVDYTVTKHAVLGLTRALYANLHPKLPIRINSIAPSWTDTGLMPPFMHQVIGDRMQSSDVAGRSVVLLMGDKNRHGELIYSAMGEYWELESGETGSTRRMENDLGTTEIEDYGKVVAALTKMAEEEAAKNAQSG